MNIELSTETIDYCIVCGSNEHSTDPKFEKLLGLVKPYHVQKCNTCHLRWLSPRPDAKGYEQLYKFETYFTFGNYAKIAEERRYYFRKRIEIAEKFFSPRPLDILDIGAATGEFVYEASQKGHHITGIEISSGARKKAQEKFNLKLLNSSVEDLADSCNYDLIHMNHVLEHLADPTKMLTQCYQRLKPGGIMVIEVPQQFYNDLDRLKKILGLAKKPEFNPYSLHHTYFFTPKLIRALFENSGFLVRILRTANKDRTPLFPLKVSNLLLGPYLFLSDKIHSGGNIIEVYAQKPE